MEKAEHQRDSDSGQSPSDNEKHVQDANAGTLEADPDAHLTADERKKIDRKLLWKLDIQLIPWLCLLYLVSFLGKSFASSLLRGACADSSKIVQTSEMQRLRACRKI